MQSVVQAFEPRKQAAVLCPDNPSLRASLQLSLSPFTNTAETLQSSVCNCIPHPCPDSLPDFIFYSMYLLWNILSTFHISYACCLAPRAGAFLKGGDLCFLQ